MITTPASAQLPNVFDTRSLAEMKARAARDPDGSLKMVAQQFEAYFIGLMLKQARQSMSGTMLDSQQSRMFLGLADEQLALNMANSGGFGFADMLVKQLQYRPRGAVDLSLKAGSVIREDGESTPDLTGKTADVRDDRAKLAARTMNRNRQMPHSAFAPARFGQSVFNAGSDDDDGDEANRLAAVGTVPVTYRNQVVAQYQRQSVAVIGAGPACPAAAPANKPLDAADAFVARIRPHAEEAAKLTGIPAKFLIGHAALETGWGKHQILKPNGQPSFNLFGIKAGRSWSGEVAQSTTTEYVDGKMTRQVEPFRAYDSYRDCFLDYAKLLQNNPRYREVLSQSDAGAFAQSLQEAGYATDPDYAKKLKSVILAQKLRDVG